ncbi:MAG: hypothetical protein AAF862_03975 [Pseudomonadota bacterium]
MAVQETIDDRSREAELLEFATAVGRHKDGRFALHIKLSQLSAENSGSFASRNAASFLHTFIRADEGRLFRLSSGDIMFISSTALPADLEDAQLNITRFFERDANLADDPPKLIDRFNLAREYRPFLALCQSIADEADTRLAPLTANAAAPLSFTKKPALEPSAASADNVAAFNKASTARVEKLQRAELPRRLLFEDEEVKALEPADLDRLESNFRILDPTNLLMDMPVAALVGDLPPQIIFSEKAIDYEALQAAILPSRDMRGDANLFERLSCIIEQRLIKKLSIPHTRTALASSFSSNIKTVLSSDFIRFDRRHRRSSGVPLILDIRLRDALTNMAEFLRMRERVRDVGYRICLSGMTTYSFAAMDHGHRLADFIKVDAPTDANLLHGEWLNHFQDSARSAGFQRMICSHCDSALDVENAKALGFSLFQGQQINAMIMETVRGEQTAARA